MHVPELNCRSRRGHTLVELVTAMVSSGMLLAGLGSVVLIASRVANAPVASSQRLEAAGAVQELTSDVRYATFFVARTPHAIEFVVADRTNDGTAERIRYEWSGIAGEPLLKTVNGGTPVAVVDSVQDFQCSVPVNSEFTTISTTSDTAEAILQSNATVVSGSERTIDATLFSAQRINPPTFSSVPANALSWNATKIGFYGRNGAGTMDTLLVRLCSSGDPNDRPTGDVLGQVTVSESSLTASTGWNTATFDSPARGLALHRSYAVTWSALGNGIIAKLQYDDTASGGVLESDDAGASWTLMPTRQVFYRLYGTYTVPGTTYSLPRNYATRASITLQTASDASSRIDASVPLVNRPELLAAYWRADFDENPTTMDITRDGTSDWTMSSGSFNDATLASGVWLANGSLESRPKNNFTANTIVEVRCRNTTVGGNGAVVRISADRQAGGHAPLEVRVQKQADGSQTLTLYGKSSDAADVALFQRSNLSSDFIRYRLTILPANDVVNLAINNTDEGTFTYPTYAPSDDNRCLAFSADTSSVEYDYVELRVTE